jgi:hypothetical protein
LKLLLPFVALTTWALAYSAANAWTGPTDCVDVVLKGRIALARAEPAHVTSPGVALVDALYTLQVDVDEVVLGAEKRTQIKVVVLADGLRAGPDELTFHLHRQRDGSYVWERYDRCP